MCDNGGVCVETDISDATCQCDMTTYTGATCSQGQFLVSVAHSTCCNLLWSKVNITKRVILCLIL